ncbi:MAG: hypothetical protein P4L41_13305 [Flavipsychrobacter sp.]|nr:hypothetical protein [Flavipsychrobacter sp.]
MTTDQSPTNRDYSTISPSAKSVLLLKGYTDIPYARAVAELISLPETFQPDFNKKDFTFWARVLHFDIRYRSINQLLAGLEMKNVLELSSGFSFRGLVAVQDSDVHYIDTDLPGIITTKKELTEQLRDKNDAPKGKLEILPVNALDEAQVKEVISHFEPGAVAIVNEGLLMYLETEEKQKLCGIIRDVLKERGGYWITADIYKKTVHSAIDVQIDDKLQGFFEQHRVEEKMFDSMEAAEAFFKSEGFVIDMEAEPEYAKSGALQHVLASTTEEQMANMGKMGKIHATWRLKLAE